jgi:hypothetical protein
MAHGIEHVLWKGQCNAICHHGPASRLESVRRGALERYL